VLFFQAALPAMFAQSVPMLPVSYPLPHRAAVLSRNSLRGRWKYRVVKRIFAATVLSAPLSQRQNLGVSIQKAPIYSRDHPSHWFYIDRRYIALPTSDHFSQIT